MKLYKIYKIYKYDIIISISIILLLLLLCFIAVDKNSEINKMERYKDHFLTCDKSFMDKTENKICKANLK